MQIFLAESAGFCAGVKKAVDIAEKAASAGEKWYTLGSLVHNQQVIEDLNKKGIKTVNSLDDINGGGVILRAHGVTPEILSAAQQKGLLIRDATCPLVKKVQELGKYLREEGYSVIIFGDSSHPETQGIQGWCDNEAVIVNSSKDIKPGSSFNKVGLISQTTKHEEEYFDLARAILPLTRELRVYNTICPATRKRQEEACLISSQVDLMVVIGDKKSSNTQVLVNKCKETGVKTLFIQSAEDLKPQLFDGVSKVGVTAGASTPDWIIKEVVDKMTQFDGENQEIKEPETLSEENFAKMEAEMADMEIPDKGDIVKGIVIQVLDDEVMVDVGGKSEGIIPLRELSVNEVKSARDIVSVGDEIEVLVLKWDDDGTILLSKKKVDTKLAMDNLESIYTNDQTVKGTVKETVKGGLLVDVGVMAFLPASHVEDGYAKNLEDYVGKTYEFKIIEFNRNKKRGSQIVLSRKELAGAEKAKAKEEFWAKIQEGQIWKGTVKRLVDYGAFIDLGGFEGLLHVSEIDHVRIDHPSSILKEGDEIEVYILALDPEKERVSLSRKKLLKSPWEKVLESIKEGDIIEGTVVRMAPFGAFLEIQPGVDGLVHISQIANHRVEKPEDVLEVGQKVEVKVLSIDSEERRIGLSIKEAAQVNNEPEVAED